MEYDGPPPEAELLESRRKAIGLPAREAARRAEISEGYWRQVAKGYRSGPKGIKYPVIAPAGTIARMAQVLEIPADELQESGREDAAELLRDENKMRLRFPERGSEEPTQELPHAKTGVSSSFIRKIPPAVDDLPEKKQRGLLEMIWRAIAGLDDDATEFVKIPRKASDEEVIADHAVDDRDAAEIRAEFDRINADANLTKWERRRIKEDYLTRRYNR